MSQISSVYLDEMPEDYLETYREKIQTLTADDVMTAARRYFDSPNEQIIIVGDAAELRDQAALFGEVEGWGADGQRVA